MGKRLIKAVGALDEKEVEQIKICDSTKRTIEVVELVGFGKLPSDSPWKDDQKAMEIITNEITSGPFNFVVLFSLDE